MATENRRREPKERAVAPRNEERRPSRDQELTHLVRGLDNLRWNLQVQADILALGERAAPALADFLQEPPSQFPEGRALATEALGHIGGEAAFQGLLRALDPRRLEDLSPLLRLSEEDVQDAVARQLARLGDRRAIPALLEALRLHRLVGAAEALARFREPAALRWLIEGLEDAFKRDRFGRMILDMGSAATPYLVDTLQLRRRRGDNELLPSLERRAAALKLLGLLHAQEATAAIRASLRDPADMVRMEAALALVSVEEGDDVLEAAPALVAGLAHADFIRRDRCADALVHIGPRCVPLLEWTLVLGSVTVGGEAVPLTVNARTAALAVLERLKEQAAC
jgi:HEAT repeat protein